MSTELQVFDLNLPAQALQVAEILQKFVKDKNLTAKIQGKDFPLVEAWEFAGSQLGLIGVITDIQKIEAPDEIKYMAKCEIRKIVDGSVVGIGVAICSNKEKMKRHFEEYAVLAMVQTRAISRAYRNVLGWIMKAAGFEATPEEEADQLKDCPDEEEKDLLRKLVYNSTLDEEKRKEAFATIDGCKTYELYQKIQHRLESLQTPYDQIPNPSATDAKHKVRQVAGNGK
jgi:hypothetical protein